MNGLVSIIILNYNGKQFNKNCLDSVFAQTYNNFEIIFVNNASTDGSCEEVKKMYADEIADGRLRIIDPGYNSGFAEGNNIGGRHSASEAKYICLLNNDVTVPTDRLSALISCIESHPMMGGVGSLVLDKGSEELRKGFYFQQHKAGYNNYILEPAHRAQTTEEQKSGVYQTTGIGGCSFLYKKSLIQEPFPKYYFAYAEDTYLSLCIIRTGHTLALCTKSVVYHHGSGSFGKHISIKKAFHGVKNNFSNLYLFHTTKNFLLLTPLLLSYHLMKIFVSSPRSRICGLIGAGRRFLTHLGLLRRQKAYVNSLTNISYTAFLYQLSQIIFDNIYLMKLSPRHYRIMGRLNRFCTLYFRSIGLAVGDH